MIYRLLKRQARELLGDLIAIQHAAIGLVGQVRAKFPAIRRIVPGKAEPGRKHVVYVHYDHWGVVHDYILQAVGELVACGYTVTFISNAPTLKDEQIAPLLPLVREVVHRRNVGYDFAAYRDGIARIPDLDNVERLIIVNDSVYGPLYPLADMLEKAEAMDVDVFGVTDTWDLHYHLQSYFMLFFPAAIRSPAFRKFWRNFPTVSNKRWLIRNGEVRLSSVLARDKLRLGALCPYWDVSRGILAKLEGLDLGKDSALSVDELKFLNYIKATIVVGKAINPSHYYWDTLISDWNCPFIKRELLQVNPVKVPKVWEWETLLREKTAYDTDLVLRHLKSL